MKKLFCVLICIVLFVSYNVMPSYALGDPIMDPTEIISLSIQDSRAGLPFVEGETGTLIYWMQYTENNNEDELVAIIEYQCQYISVPNTTNKVKAKLILNDFSDQFADILDAFVCDHYDVELLRSASKYYNCHSYAWYSRSSTNTYWIDDPGLFYRYNSYYEKVTDPDIGDIICYYAADGTILHSGIVNAVNNQSSNEECGDSNTVEVISKWGMSGLFKHNGYECPYTNYVEHSADNPPAVDVEYFRQHSHMFTYIRNIMNPSVHTATCNTCGYSFTDNHTYQSLPDGSSCCTKCGYTSSGQIIMSDPLKSVDK